ncbi:hypothetical protein FQR65_LT10753 [Abscondita terminalis]|nr:hypothetical protein FQR65_LT10753 [Abscondita terminalis]
MRFIGGVGLALVATGATIYVGEIAEKDIRGKLGSAFNILRLIGSLYVFSLGPFLSYFNLALSCAAFPIIFMIAFSFMPESPYYLIKTNQYDLARRNLIRLSKNSASNDFIDARLKEIQATVDYDMQNRGDVKELFSNKLYRKSLIVIAGVKTVQQLSGVAAIEAYTQTIIEVSQSSISPEISSIIAGVIQFPAAILAGYLVDRVGRKPLLIISAVGCSIALFSEGLYFYLQNVLKIDVTSIGWLPTVGLLFYLVMNPIGIFTLPWILLGELFATNIKGYAVCAASTYGTTLSMAGSSAYLAWSSPTLPKITSEHSPIGTALSKDEASWVASSFLLGAIPGCIFAGWAVEKFGPKLSLLFCFIPLFLPWIVIIFAQSAIVLCIARFFAGSSFAIVTTSGSIYVGEISEKDIRGKLCTAFNIMKLTGSLFVLSIGPFVSYTALAISCGVLPVVFVILFYFMPESPHYLIKIGKMEEARLNLIRLSCNNRPKSEIDEQLKEIEDTVLFAMQNKSTLWEMLSKKEYRKSVIVITGIKMIQQLTGYSAIEAYMQTIVESSGSSISPEISSIVCGVVQLPAALLAAVIVDKLGRKPLLIISCVGCGLALIGESVYFYLQDVVKDDVGSIAWLPTTGLMLYLIMNPIGIFTLPYVLLGELFATNIKAVALSASTIFGVTLGFLVTKFFEPISASLGLFACFAIFAAICFSGALFVYTVQPETKGKSFQEIQDKLNRDKNVQNNLVESYITTHF